MWRNLTVSQYFRFAIRVKLTIKNSNCQGTKKIVRVIESSSFREMGLKQ